MARPRKPPPSRSRSAAWERRDAAARAKGYASYYDYRLHDSGRLPPGPLGALSAEERARRRGHRGRKDFLASLSEGDLIVMPFGLSSIVFDPDARSGQGAYLEIVKTVIYAATGKERTFTLRNLTRAELVATIEAEQAKGVVFSPSPSLDQRRLLEDEEVDGGY